MYSHNKTRENVSVYFQNIKKKVHNWTNNHIVSLHKSNRCMNLIPINKKKHKQEENNSKVILHE